MSTLEELYTCFERYKPIDLDCCSCCHDSDFVKNLKSIPLRLLTEPMLYDYFCSALYTCGGTSAFKYFLPRLFELFPDDVSQFYAKFRYVNWEEWDAVEITAIKTHVFSLWASGDWSYYFSEFFEFFSFGEILGFWTDLTFLRKCLPFAAYFEFDNLFEKEKTYAILEDLFFAEADKNEEFAQELSIAASCVNCLRPWS